MSSRDSSTRNPRKPEAKASLSGKRVPVAAGTLCLHGDQPGAVAFARALRTAFKEKQIDVAAP